MADIPHDIRMRLLTLNNFIITGYSACWNGYIISLYAYGKKDVSFYDDYFSRYKSLV